MSPLIELAQQIEQLYPLKDNKVGKRYRVVSELAGMTELEEIGGAPRYVSTAELKDRGRWDHAVAERRSPWRSSVSRGRL